MIAGRLHWKPAGAKVPGKVGLAAFDFSTGTLTLTEAGTKKRAAIHLVTGEQALGRGSTAAARASRLHRRRSSARAITRENHTLKRALTDPHILSGIGNAYSDEILHTAQALAGEADAGAQRRRARAALRGRCGHALRLDRAAPCSSAGGEFPEGVTAFRPEMAVHGRYGRPCPECGAPVQRIRHADNETNYCAKCQTGGKLLADRALSRLLRADWPRTLEEMEERRGLAPRSNMGGPTRRGRT